MKTTTKILILTVFLSLLSCEDILEKDITDDLVQVVYPQNNTSVYSNAVTFQWNELSGASKYRVQVFSSDSSVVLDSLVNKTTLTYPLSQGNYQWRVRGENYAYVSSYSNSIGFSIFETTDLTNQQVILSSPADSFYTNNPSVILSWQSLTAASSYSFELINVTNGETLVNQQSNITNNSLTLNNTILSQDAEYRWKIKGVNSSSQTPFAFRRFFLDTNDPNQPTNLLPANNSTQTINQQLSFSWSIPNDLGSVQSPISYEIEFANNLLFSPIIQTSSVTTNSFQQSFSSAGDYYWRIKAKDLAGNVSLISNPFKFTVN